MCALYRSGYLRKGEDTHTMTGKSCSIDGFIDIHFREYFNKALITRKHFHKKTSKIKARGGYKWKKMS